MLFFAAARKLKQMVSMPFLKMGNSAPREGMEPTSLPFRDSLLTITTTTLLDVTTLSMLPNGIAE